MASIEVPKLITEAHDRWKFASESDRRQREAELDDLRFDALKQWPDDIIEQRKGDEAKRIPARPCLTISLLRQPISQIDNAQEQAQFSPSVKPKDGKASKVNAEAAQGLLRHIQNQSHAAEARMWGAKRANRCGRGYWRIVSRYVDNPDAVGADAFDQELYIEKILNQFTVYFDPTAKQPNKSDAKWVIVTDMLTEDDYKAKYDKSELSKVADRSLEEWADIGTSFPGWVSTDAKGQRTYRIADYIRIELTPVRTIVEIKRGETSKLLSFKAGETIEIPSGWRKVDERVVKRKTVKWDTINAIESLRVNKWPGQHLPIIEMVVDEKNVDGERIYEGLIRASKDAQRSYNYMRSAQVETIGLAPKAPFTADMRAIGQYKASFWDKANTDNFSVLPYDSVDANGEQIPDARPKREVAEPAIQAVTTAAQIAISDVRATTMVPEVSLGQTDPRYRAQGAIARLQNQSDLATSGFLMSMRNAVAWEDEILLDLIPFYYDRPGRVIEILDGEPAQSKSVMLGQHFVPDADGVPQAVEEGHPDGQLIDLKNLKATVEVSIAKAFPTRRAEEHSNIIDMMGTSPEASKALAPLAMKYADTPGSDEAYTVLKRLLWPPDLQGDGKTPDPAQLQAQLQQMHGVMQQMGQELQEFKAGIQKALIDKEKAVEVARIQAASAGAVAETKANTDLAETIIKDEAQRAGIDAENARTALDAHGTKLEHAHEFGLQVHQQAHEKSMPKPEPAGAKK